MKGKRKVIPWHIAIFSKPNKRSFNVALGCRIGLLIFEAEQWNRSMVSQMQKCRRIFSWLRNYIFDIDHMRFSWNHCYWIPDVYLKLLFLIRQFFKIFIHWEIILRTNSKFPYFLKNYGLLQKNLKIIQDPKEIFRSQIFSFHICYERTNNFAFSSWNIKGIMSSTSISFPKNYQDKHIR